MPINLSKEDKEFLETYKDTPTYEQCKKMYDNGKISTERFNELVKRRAKVEVLQANKEHYDYRNKEAAHAALDIATSAIPMGGALKGIKAASAITKKLTPYVGRKIAETTTKGAAEGAIAGLVHGTLSAAIDNKDPIKEGVKEAAIGGAIGIAAGAATGKVVQKLDANKLINTPQKEKIKPAKQYYSDYERGIKIENKVLGEIKMASDAYKETIIQNPKFNDMVIDLSKDIKGAKYIAPEAPKHEHKNYDIVKFHRLRGKNADYLIAENSKGNKYFYKVIDPEVTGPKPEPQSLSYITIPPKSSNFNYPSGLYNKNIQKGAENLTIKGARFY